MITKYEIYVSQDNGRTYQKACEGDWEADHSWKTAEFSPVMATDVKLQTVDALSAAEGKQFASAAEIRITTAEGEYEALRTVWEANSQRVKTEYTTETWAVFERAMQKAEQILTQQTADKTAVLLAKEALVRAADALKKAEIKNPDNPPVKEPEDKNPQNPAVQNPVTAQQGKHYRAGNYFYRVTSAKKQTVQVTVGSANTELIYSFVAAIIPAGSGEAEGADPVGTGPFSYVSYEPLKGITMAKNPDYWQEGLPYLDSVEFKIMGDGDTSLMELQGGTVDFYAYLTDSQAQALKDSHQVISSPTNMVQALFLNNAVEPLNDVRVRQAISYALDKDEINGFVGGGNGTLISSAMLPTLKEYYVDLNETYGSAANVEKAKELMADAGYGDGFDMEIAIVSTYPFHMQTGEVIVEQLKNIGINATIKGMENGTWLDEVYNGRQFDATITALTCDMTPGYLMNRFQTDSKKNFINFQSAAYDENYAKAQAVLDPEEKAGYYKELQKILCDEAGSVFIQAPANMTAISKRLAGYKFYPVYVQDMSTVYIVE